MIELNAQTLIAPNILSLIPTLEGPASAESTTSSTPIAQDFSALLTELMGPVAESAAEPVDAPAVPAAESVQLPVTPVSELMPNEPKATQPEKTKETGNKVDESVLNSTPAPVVPCVSFAATTPVAVENERELKPATTDLTKAEHKQAAADLPPVPAATTTRQPEIERAWSEVRKFEFTVQHEAARPAEVRPTAQAAQAAPAAAAAQKQAMVTTDPIANTRQEQLPPRVIAIQKVTIETRLPEREAKPEVGTPSTDTTSTAPIHFNDVARSIGAAASAEQVLPAHHVEIPNVPHVQVVRTVAMEVGDADSKVVIHIQERGGDVSLQLNAVSEPLRQELQSSVGSLVRALRREEVQVSSVEVSRKPSIDKVRRMKEAR